MKKLIVGLSVIAAVSAGCNRQEPLALVAAEEHRGETQAVSSQPQPVALPGMTIGQLAICRPSDELMRAAEWVINTADVNRDERISREEANNLMNFLVGGVFFRADLNNDGTITPEEGRQVRSEFLSQHPALASLARAVQSRTGRNPLAIMAQMVDIEYGKPLTLAEARQATENFVNDFYAMVDGDRSGAITLTEARVAAQQGGSVLGNAIFEAADVDRSGALSFEEFEASLRSLARPLFDLADIDKNGQLSLDESNATFGQILSRAESQGTGGGTP